MNIIIVICIIFVIFVIFFKKKKTLSSPHNNFNNFNNFSNFEETTDINNKKNNIDDNTVLIFYAPWCGHCKKSLPDFKKAVSEGDNIIMINSDDEPELTKKYNVNGFPTIMKASGEQYTGSRDSDSILKFSKS